MSYSELNFNRVVVIESLRPRDLKTGRRIYEDVFNPLKAQDEYQDIQTDIEVVEDALAFEEVLRQVALDSLGGSYPILHIEAHGSRTGLQLTSGETIPWEWLKAATTTINTATRLNLLVTLGACSGGWFSTIAVPPGRAPFFCLVAPLAELSAGQVEVSFQSFYNTLFKSRDIGTALHQMNSDNGGLPFNYSLNTAREIFQHGFEAYAKDHMTADKLAERENDFVQRVREDGGPEFKDMPELELRKIYRTQVEGERAAQRYEQFKRSYFMCDLYPDNYERFGLTLLSGSA